MKVREGELVGEEGDLATRPLDLVHEGAGVAMRALSAERGGGGVRDPVCGGDDGEELAVVLCAFGGVDELKLKRLCSARVKMLGSEGAEGVLKLPGEVVVGDEEDHVRQGGGGFGVMLPEIKACEGSAVGLARATIDMEGPLASPVKGVVEVLGEPGLTLLKRKRREGKRSLAMVPGVLPLKALELLDEVVVRDVNLSSFKEKKVLVVGVECVGGGCEECLHGLSWAMLAQLEDAVVKMAKT